LKQQNTLTLFFARRHEGNNFSSGNLPPESLQHLATAMLIDLNQPGAVGLNQAAREKIRALEAKFEGRQEVGRGTNRIETAV